MNVVREFMWTPPTFCQKAIVNAVLHPGEVGVALGRDAVFPAFVVAQALAVPALQVDRYVRYMTKTCGPILG
jgi:hypothetical protein